MRRILPQHLGLFIILFTSQPALAQFGVEHIISTGALGAIHVQTADLDNDGDEDILSASLLDNKIAWYENTSGFGDFGLQRVITLNALKVSALHVADIDADGNLDVLSASRDDSKIAWYRNQGGGLFGDQQVISTDAFVAQSVAAADLDGDGDLDVLSASRDDDKIAWYENTNGLGLFGDQQVISNTLPWAVRVIAVDIDRDGDFDVVAGAELDDKVVWFENNGAGVFGAEELITSTADAVRSIFASDLDNDGFVDILSASSADDKIAWYRNTDGAGTFSTANIITTAADFAQDVFAADLDLDGDLDVLSASGTDAKIAWYENLNGLGAFGVQQVISDSALVAASVFAANLDGDADIDVLSASGFDNKISWYESFAGRGRVRFGDVSVISGFPNAIGAQTVNVADLDGDGDQDVLSASYNDGKIAWYENNRGILGAQNVITVSAAGARDVAAADIDGDGDQDVLSASHFDNAIRWYENFDGKGGFEIIHLISVNANNAYAVYPADIDGDGDQDVLSASFEDDRIAWYENEDGAGTFSSQINISKATKGATDVVAADLDGDGDIDVVSASSFDDKIAWYENLDGAGTFGQQIVISDMADLAIAVHVVDLDLDGDLDVISASSGDDKIAWYRNLDGQGTFASERIVTVQANRAFSVYTADLDSDGDQDILSGSRDDNRVAWYENKGDDTFGPQQTVTTDAMGVRSVIATDLDGDGDPDLLSASQDDSKIAWYENLSFMGTTVSSNEATEVAGREYDLIHIYPNPFTSRATLTLTLEKTQRVKVTVYDVQGRQVGVLYRGMLVGGQPQSLHFNAHSQPAGVYLIRIAGESFHVVRKAILVK